MKKHILLIALCIIQFFAIGNETPNNFKIGNFLELYDKDSILFYYNCLGFVTEKDCAVFYRKGRIDRINVNLTGDFKDYFISGALAMEGTIKDDMLNGRATYYYENGNVKATGSYKDDFKAGVWIYNYENGNTEK